jgi:hypothetical protein
MKKKAILTFCFCIIFSSLCFAESSQRSGAIYPHSNSSASKPAARKDFPNIIRPLGRWLKRLFGKKPEVTYCPVAIIKNLILSRTEVIASCSANNTACSNNNQSIQISTETFNEANDVLVYDYKISGGKIVGKGEKVVWDLSGEKPGIYTITGSVDDGVGAYANPITKEVRVVECPDCK